MSLKFHQNIHSRFVIFLIIQIILDIKMFRKFSRERIFSWILMFSKQMYRRETADISYIYLCSTIHSISNENNTNIQRCIDLVLNIMWCFVLIKYKKLFT